MDNLQADAEQGPINVTRKVGPGARDFGTRIKLNEEAKKYLKELLRNIAYLPDDVFREPSDFEDQVDRIEKLLNGEKIEVGG